MSTHSHHCPGCGRRVRVVMDTKTDTWVFTRHRNERTGGWCTNSGKRLP